METEIQVYEHETQFRGRLFVGKHICMFGSHDERVEDYSSTSKKAVVGYITGIYEQVVFELPTGEKVTANDLLARQEY